MIANPSIGEVATIRTDSITTIDPLAETVSRETEIAPIIGTAQITGTIGSTGTIETIVQTDRDKTVTTEGISGPTGDRTIGETIAGDQVQIELAATKEGTVEIPIEKVEGNSETEGHPLGIQIEGIEV